MRSCPLISLSSVTIFFELYQLPVELHFFTICTLNMYLIWCFPDLQVENKVENLARLYKT